MVHRIIHRTYHKHRSFWNKEHIMSLLWSLALFGIALVFQKVADDYVIETGGIPVGDILLNNIPTIEIDGLIMMSTLLFTGIVIGLNLSKPEYVIFAIKSISLFVIIRAFFISLTHLGVHPDQLVFKPDEIGFYLYDLLYNTRNDFFFSGHTGIPFLMSLVFYKEVFWRRLFLGISLTFGTFVILGHMHYSIDVFAAPFMTYSIFSIAKYIFRKDYLLTQE